MHWLRTCPSASIFVFPVLSVILLLLSELALAYKDYCVIGAGPSGLQLGFYLQRAARDYVIFEKSNISAALKNRKHTIAEFLLDIEWAKGSFFHQFPRHRTLISINKRHTGKSNKEFNMRHDWNSLLSDNEDLLFTKYSREFLPPADRYLDYLRDYQQTLGINVQFNTEVGNMKKEVCEHALDKHVYTMTDQHGNVYRCGRVILATGISKPFIPDVPGIEHTVGYEDMSLDTEDFEGKTVLILGRGNSAFETATHIYGSTNLIHMVARSRVRLSWATHYVGDLRAVNNALLDTYQLKSLDGVLEASVNEIRIVKDTDGKLFLKIREDEGDDGESQSAVGEMENEDEIDNFAMREPYDAIIRCLGFHFDTSIFNESLVVKRPKGRSKKYISIKHNYEVEDQPGMFVAGTATHSLDFRKSAGGFIHGFRYTTRALFHLMEWRYEGIKWPSVSGPYSQLISHIVRRINEASGMYQMFSMLGDIVILQDNDTYTYLEEFPIHLLDQLVEMTGHPASRVIVVNLQYGADFSGPGNDVFRHDRATGDASQAHDSNFLHPCFYYYEQLPSAKEMKHKPKKEHLPRPTALHHIVEDFLSIWNAPDTHLLPLRRFIENVLNQDLRNYLAEDCMRHALTHTNLPYNCHKYYMNGQGLAPSQIHLTSVHSRH